MICCYYCVAIPWWVFHSALFVASRVRCTSVWKTAVYRHITTASYSYSPFSEFLHPICVEHFSVAVFFILSCFIYFLIHVILCINVCMFSLIPPLVANLLCFSEPVCVVIVTAASRRVLLLLHFTGLLVPTLLIINLVYATLLLFIPIMGRAGTASFPDLFIGCLTVSTVIVLSMWQVTVKCLCDYLFSYTD